LRWLPVVSDALIGLACIAIASALLYLLREIKQPLAASGTLITLAAFIIACGVSHLIEARTLWHPAYGVAGAVKLLTALALVAVVLILPLVAPKLYTLLQAEVAAEKFCYELETAHQELALLHQRVQEVESSSRQQMETLQRQQVAELQHTNQMKDEFLAVLSHELRTPLNAILGWAKLLRTRQFDAMTTARALETIERNANLQVQHVEDLLELARIIQGKLSLQTRTIDLLPLVQSTLAGIEPAARNKAIQVTLESNIGLNQHKLVTSPDIASRERVRQLPVFGDPDRLQQVIWKLLHNAVKFTPEYGAIAVQLEQTPTAVELRVIDSGVGIAAEFLPHVFDQFRQANSALNRSFDGLGLGLAIVRYLVELHGGAIEAQSAGVGLGSTFVVTLPLAVEQP
jgi:signal transduction histidine kinase